MNKIYKFACAMLTGMTLLGTTSCSDPEDEIKSVSFDRLLSPADVELKIVDKINVKATLYLVTVPSYIDVKIEVDENPLATTENFKTLKEYTLTTAELNDAKAHGTLTHNISGLTYFKKYRVTFKSRDAQGKVSKESSAIAITDGIFKNYNDNDRANNSLTAKWLEDINVTKITIMKVNGETEEKVAEVTLDDTAKGACKYKHEGLDANTEYAFYIYDGDNCLGKTNITTFPNYKELFADVDVDFDTEIENLPEGYALMLSPSETTNIFSFGDDKSKTIVLGANKSLRIIARNTKPVVLNKLSFEFDGAAGLSVENISFKDSEKKSVFMKFTNASGEYKFSGVTMEGYKNFAQDPGSNDCTVKLLEIKNSFFHDGFSGRFVDFQKKKVLIEKVDIQQNTFANICNTQDFLRFDYAEGKMPAVYVANNSFYKVNASSKGLFYIRSNDKDTQNFKAEIVKNVFESCKDGNGVYFGEDAKVNGLSFKNNYYKDSPNLLTAFSAGQTAFDPDPKEYTGSAFKNADSNDFTISNATVLKADVGNTEFKKAE